MKKKVLVIAEAGVNHNGSLDMAVDLIKEASKAGADIVKFQTFFTDDGITQKAIKAKKLKKNVSEVLKNPDVVYDYLYDY